MRIGIIPEADIMPVHRVQLIECSARDDRHENDCHKAGHHKCFLKASGKGLVHNFTPICTIQGAVFQEVDSFWEKK